MAQKPQFSQFLAYNLFLYSHTRTWFALHGRATPVLHFMFWLLRCTLWLKCIMLHNLELSSLVKPYGDPYNFLNHLPNKTCDTLLESTQKELHFVLLHIWHIKSQSGYGSRFESNCFLIPSAEITLPVLCIMTRGIAGSQVTLCGEWLFSS